ncbi:MAG: hypothetical protein ACLTSG_10525 [Lachnospiraceae bacterium]
MDKVASDGMDFTIDPDQHFHRDGFKTSCSAAEIGIMDAAASHEGYAAWKMLCDAAPCIGPTRQYLFMSGLVNYAR